MTPTGRWGFAQGLSAPGVFPLGLLASLPCTLKAGGCAWVRVRAAGWMLGATGQISEAAAGAILTSQEHGCGSTWATTRAGTPTLQSSVRFPCARAQRCPRPKVWVFSPGHQAASGQTHKGRSQGADVHLVLNRTHRQANSGCMDLRRLSERGFGKEAMEKAGLGEGRCVCLKCVLGACVFVHSKFCDPW